jgi:hypothetical protein
LTSLPAPCSLAPPLNAFAEPAPWPRPQFEPGGGDAFLFFAIYGRFPASVELSGEEYRTAGVPGGISIRKLNRAGTPIFPFSSDELLGVLHPKQPELFAATQHAPECMIVQGTVNDPPDLNYFRDTLGLVMYFLDHGGLAVIDPLQFKLYAPSAWRTEMFDPPFDARRHVEILWSGKPGDTRWFHTRGLRKFGRPDLSFHGVRAEHNHAVIDLFNGLIVRQAEGGRIPEGEQVQLPGWPSALKCRHSGSLDDPDFNNVHIEIGWDRSF